MRAILNSFNGLSVNGGPVPLFDANAALSVVGFLLPASVSAQISLCGVDVAVIASSTPAYPWLLREFPGAGPLAIYAGWSLCFLPIRIPLKSTVSARRRSSQRSRKRLSNESRTLAARVPGPARNQVAPVVAKTNPAGRRLRTMRHEAHESIRDFEVEPVEATFNSRKLHRYDWVFLPEEDTSEDFNTSAHEVGLLPPYESVDESSLYLTAVPRQWLGRPCRFLRWLLSDHLDDMVPCLQRSLVILNRGVGILDVEIEPNSELWR
ncbi:glycosyltransferase family 15 protein [Apiospora sp. TS-2023a]